tara:strand:- start:29 stop:292 length:264 start_codon:yes stop_codon:yes gene_type:complete
MKKVILVLGLAMLAMSFVSCEKEEVQTDCDKEVIGLNTQLSETGYTVVYVATVNSNGVTYRYQVSETTWNNLQEEIAENGSACLTGY